MPLERLSLAAHKEALRESVVLGYTDVWSGEADVLDAFVPLAAAEAWEPTLKIGTSIVPVFTRGPAVLAMTAASFAGLAPERFTLGLGASAPVVVSGFNGVPHQRSFDRTRDVLRFVQRTMRGERIREHFDSLDIDGFALARPPASVPDVLLAALRPKMLQLAATEAAGAITTWLSPTDAAVVARELNRVAARQSTPRLMAWITVSTDEDAEVIPRPRSAADRRLHERAVLSRLPSMARQRSVVRAGVGRVGLRRTPRGIQLRQRCPGRRPDRPWARRTMSRADRLPISMQASRRSH